MHAHTDYHIPTYIFLLAVKTSWLDSQVCDPWLYRQVPNNILALPLFPSTKVPRHQSLHWQLARREEASSSRCALVPREVQESSEESHREG